MKKIILFVVLLVIRAAGKGKDKKDEKEKENKKEKEHEKQTEELEDTILDHTESIEIVPILESDRYLDPNTLNLKIKGKSSGNTFFKAHECSKGEYVIFNNERFYLGIDQDENERDRINLLKNTPSDHWIMELRRTSGDKSIFYIKYGNNCLFYNVKREIDVKECKKIKKDDEEAGFYVKILPAATKMLSCEMKSDDVKKSRHERNHESGKAKEYYAEKYEKKSEQDRVDENKNLEELKRKRRELDDKIKEEEQKEENGENKPKKRGWSIGVSTAGEDSDYKEFIPEDDTENQRDDDRRDQPRNDNLKDNPRDDNQKKKPWYSDLLSVPWKSNSKDDRKDKDSNRGNNDRDRDSPRDNYPSKRNDPYNDRKNPRNDDYSRDRPKDDQRGGSENNRKGVSQVSDLLKPEMRDQILKIAQMVSNIEEADKNERQRYKT